MRQLLIQTLYRVEELMKTRDHNLAVQIANKVGKTFGGK